MSHTPLPGATLLGQSVSYPDHYDPAVLHAIPREAARQALGYAAVLPFQGADIWRAYELSWLNARGKPLVATASFVIPADSPNLIESKSFKLYLNSHNQARHASAATLQELLARDLSRVAQAPVQVALQLEAGDMATPPLAELSGQCIDGLDIDIERYDPAPELLACRPDAGTIEETLVSRLLRSNCPVTSQPDWGSVQIQYRGPAMDHAALLRYIVSYRTHTGFHEQCVEQIFRDIMAQCRPEQLRVHACYTRRGGLDINPWRGTRGMPAPDAARTPRQ